MYVKINYIKKENHIDDNDTLLSISLKINTERSLHAMLGSDFHKRKITKTIVQYLNNSIVSCDNLIEHLNQNFIIAEESTPDFYTEYDIIINIDIKFYEKFR